MKVLWVFLGGQHKIGLYLVVFLCILGSFPQVKVQNRGYFWELPKFQISIWGEIPDIFGGER